MASLAGRLGAMRVVLTCCMVSHAAGVAAPEWHSDFGNTAAQFAPASPGAFLTTDDSSASSIGDGSAGLLEKELSQSFARTPPSANADGPIEAPDPHSGEGENPVEHVPVVGSQFEVNPVSTATKCVINLTVQYMIIYTALALARVVCEAVGKRSERFPVTRILETAALTVNYAPMLSVLFLACRMRVLWLTQGQGNPPTWMQLCMYLCTYSVLLTTVIVCVIPIFTGEVIGVDQKTGDINHSSTPFKSSALAICFTVLKFILLLALYAGVLAIIVGINTYEPPRGSWPLGAIPPVSPAVQCTVIMACQFFLLYFLVQLVRTLVQFAGQNRAIAKFETAILTATNAMNFAPMLSILFIAARMRALQMDPLHGHPQSWAQMCFFFCTFALTAQTILAICVPLIFQGEASPGKREGDMEYVVPSTALGGVLIFVRYLIMLFIYASFTAIIASIFLLEHPAGPQYTIPISVTMQCVINLTVQFFTIHLAFWICYTVTELTGVKWPTLTQTMENAKATVMFCPMLAILFVATRMRALQLTKNRGAPQGYAQDGMYMATWAVAIQFTMCLLAPLVSGAPTPCDGDGNVHWPTKNRVLYWVVQGVRWTAFMLLYGGVIAVMIGICTMTPENANGRGAVPLVGDGRVPGTEIDAGGGIKEPPGLDDIPTPSAPK